MPSNYQEYEKYEEGNRPHVIFDTEGGFHVEGYVIEKIVHKPRIPSFTGSPCSVSVLVDMKNGPSWFGFRSVDRWEQAIGNQTLF